MIFVHIILGVVLTQYQNCAPSAEALNQDTGLPVTGIDQINVGQISFPQQKVQAQTSNQLVVVGVCDQSGALISWKLFNSNGEKIDRGLAECELGSFTVDLTDRWENHCGDDLELSAFLGVNASSQTIIETTCQ